MDAFCCLAAIQPKTDSNFCILPTFISVISRYAYTFMAGEREVLAEYQLYLRYVAAFGSTFSEKELSQKAWQAAKVLMKRALDNSGPIVTMDLIWQYMKNMAPAPSYA